VASGEKEAVGHSVAAELALLVAVVVLPLGGLGAYLLYDLARSEFQHSSMVVRQMAGTVADRARNRLDEVRSALEIIARRPLVRAMDPDRCDPGLAELRELYPRAVNIVMVNLEGRIICGAIPPPRGSDLRISDDALQREMIAAPRFRVSQPLVGRISKRWAVSAVQPVFGDDKRLVGTVSMSLDLLNWFSFAGIDGFSNDAIAALITWDGVVIARSEQPEKWVGRDASSGGTHQKALVVKDGVARATGLAGVDRFWAFVPVPDSDWYAAAGLRSEQVYGPVQRRMFQAAILLLAALAVAVGVAVLFIRRLLKPLRAIAGAVRARGAGRLELRAPEAGPREVAELAGELNRMIDSGERMQQAVRDSEERYRRIAESSPDAIFIHSEYRIVLVNPAMVKLLGARDAAQLVGKRATFMLAAQTVGNAELRMQRIYAGERLPRVERLYRRMDGSLVDVEISAAPIVFDGKPAAHVTVRDISERRSSDEELRRFRAAMEISGDAVLLIDRATLRYVDVNQTFCELVGYARKEILGMTPMDLFSADRATLERDYDAIIADNNAPASRVEGWYTRKDGTRIPVETRRRALLAKGGWIIVGTARDISERREAEARISRLNRMHTVLSGINAAIVRIRGRDELFAEAVRIAVDHGGMQSAWMGLVDEVAQEVQLVAWAGCDEPFVQSLRGRTSMRLDMEEGAGIVARAATSRLAVVSNDVSADERVTLREELGRLGVRSLAVLPILVDGATAAVLTLHSSERGFFDEQEMKLLLELAGDIAFALEHIANREKVDYLAYYDELTGLANRRLFVERLSQFLHAAGQAGDKLAVVVADIERLRVVNESLGRIAGDAVLKTIAARLSAAAERAEIARVSANHFALVLRGIKGRSAVTRRIDRLWHEVFGPPLEVGGTELRIAARAGVAMYPGDGSDPDALIRGAEAALLRAKQTGERQVFHAAEMTERTAEKLTLENRLRQALEREEFVLHYQPKVEVETQRIVGVEALIRWQNPGLGLVPPGQFIPLMEETGIILEVGAWALRRAVLDHKRWTEMDLPAPRVAVNVSAVQLRKKDYVATLQEALRQGTRVPGVDLEITESLVMDDIQGNIDKLKEVRSLGVGIAIDDFGTGYSSLGYLARLPVQALKIDRSFIVTMLTTPETMTLVSTIISLAHSLKLKVVAEGVDDPEQAKLLRLLRCDEMQGYLYSRPVPFDELTALLRKA
jgi:diguanylate cyclase (GGDEF)-like protein/PAS domain S-box-containing protein